MRARPWFWQDPRYQPLPKARPEWITQQEIVARIEAVRAQQEPLTLPLGRLGESVALRRRAS